MELGRWGRVKLSRLSKGYRELTKFMTDVLDGERSLLDNGNEAAPIDYEVRGDFARILADPSLKGLKGKGLWIELFDRFAPYFEAGFLLRGQGEEVVLESMFIFGKLYRSDAGAKPALSLGLPLLPDGHVYSGRADAVLRLFKLDKVARLKDTSAFAVSPVQGTQIVLICGRPRLWQLDALEEAVRVIAALRGNE